MRFYKLLKKLKKFFYLNKNKSRNIILVERNYLNPSMLSFFYLVKILSDKHDAKGYCYNPTISFNFIILIKEILKTFIWIKKYIIYSYINLRPLNLLFFTKKRDIEKFDELKIKLKNKSDVLNIHVDGIRVGDLFYDNYLRRCREYTVKFDKKFYDSIKKSYLTFLYWQKFIKKNDVKAVVGSHTVYDLGIPIRIAQKMNIPCYIAGPSHIYQIKENRYNLFDPNFKNPINFFNEKDKNILILNSEEELKKKFNPDDKFFTEQNNTSRIIKADQNRLNTFNLIKKKNFFKKNGKPNVVISAHCFFDSPHSEGIFLFEDFYEWLDYLGNISKEIDYNWYLKKHPHSVEKELNSLAVNEIIAKYPNLQLLDEDINNTEILNEGVSLVLTVCGSAGYEYSYFGVPVILASNDVSYSNYGICYKPKTKKDYKEAILNFRKIKFNFDKKEIAKYYVNYFLSFWSVVPNTTFIKKKIGALKFFNSFELLYVWYDQSDQLINKKKTEIQNFINSNYDEIIEADLVKSVQFKNEETLY